MKIKSILSIILVTFFIASCGPIIGQAMRATEGVKSFEVTKGDIKSLKTAGNVLIYGPFSIEEEGRYICRGEDAQDLNFGFNKSGVFPSEVYIERDTQKVDSMRESLRTKSSSEIQTELGLKNAPDTILFGTILLRDTTVAPTRGVVMDVKFRFEFYKISDKTSTIIEIHVRELSQYVLPATVSEIKIQKMI